MPERKQILPQLPLRRWGIFGRKLLELPPVFVDIPQEITVKLDGIDIETGGWLPRVVFKFKVVD